MTISRVCIRSSQHSPHPGDHRTAGRCSVPDLRRDAAASRSIWIVLENYHRIARRLHTEEVGTEHLLLSMIRDVDCVATRILITLNINLPENISGYFGRRRPGSERVPGGITGRGEKFPLYDGSVLYGHDGQSGRRKTRPGSGERRRNASAYAGLKPQDEEQSVPGRESRALERRRSSRDWRSGSHPAWFRRR